MRGKPKESYSRENVPRITPADAGKTMAIRYMCRNIEDHPRGCGENKNKETVNGNPDGSPPRMRGKLFAHAPPELLLRITPADAGKTHEGEV